MDFKRLTVCGFVALLCSLPSHVRAQDKEKADGDSIGDAREVLQELDQKLSMAKRALSPEFAQVLGALEHAAQTAATPKRAKLLRSIGSRYRASLAKVRTAYTKANTTFQPCAQRYYQAEGSSDAPPTSEAGKAFKKLEKAVLACIAPAKARIAEIGPVLDTVDALLTEAQEAMTSGEEE